MDRGTGAGGLRDGRRGIPAFPFCHLRLVVPKPAGKSYPAELRTVGDHLKRRRLDLRLTQKEVAREIGVCQKTYEYWEQGRTAEPELRFYPAIIRFLGYDPTASEATASIGERLRARRRTRGLSRKKAAALLGIDESTLWKWEERGEQARPARRVMRAVEEFLKDEGEF